MFASQNLQYFSFFLSIFYRFSIIFSRLVTEIEKDSIKLGLIMFNSFLTNSPFMGHSSRVLGPRALAVYDQTFHYGDSDCLKGVAENFQIILSTKRAS